MDSYAGKIAEVDAQLAETDRIAATREELREKRERLAEAERAEALAHEKAREKEAAARDVREAEAAEREAQAAPLRVDLGDAEREIGTAYAAGDAYVWQVLRDARPLHRRLVALVDARNAIADRLRAIGERPDHMHAPTFENLVRVTVRRLDANQPVGHANWAIASEEG